MAELKWSAGALRWLEEIYAYIAADNPAAAANVIAYLHRAEAAAIDILGVFHGALDIDRYLP